jgi:hypothetical protein
MTDDGHSSVATTTVDRLTLHAAMLPNHGTAIAEKTALCYVLLSGCLLSRKAIPVRDRGSPQG